MKHSIVTAATVVGFLAFAALPAVESLNNIGDADFFLLSSLSTFSDQCEEYQFCVNVKEGNLKKGGRILVDECDWSEGWRVETVQGGGAILFHAGDDNDMCMQAGHGGEIGDSSVRMRLYPCDSSNPLQRFVWHDDENDCSGGPIKLQDNEDLCLTWSGTTLNPGSDSMIMIACDMLGGGRSSGWIAV